jgi:hypothetical protein
MQLPALLGEPLLAQRRLERRAHVVGQFAPRRSRLVEEVLNLRVTDIHRFHENRVAIQCRQYPVRKPPDLLLVDRVLVQTLLARIQIDQVRAPTLSAA